MADNTSRSGKVWQPVLLILLAGSGLAAGYLIPSGGTDVEAPPETSTLDAIPPESTPSPPATRPEHRFSLTGFDVRDSIQAPRIVSDGDAGIWMTWESQTGDAERSLWFTRSQDRGHSFEEPRVLRRVPIHQWDVVVRGKPSKRSSRLWPRLAYSDGTLHLSWVQPAEDDPSQLTLQISRSTDGGESFEEPVDLSAPEAVRPTFVDLSVSADETLSASWLDHRNGAQQPFASLLSGDALEERLVFAGPDERGICPCCNTATLTGDDGTQYVAFRNHVDGYRDMWLSVRPAGESEFEPPIPIAGNRWRFDGCPHDGPSLAIHDGQLHAVWMDAHTGTERVYHARAGIGEWNFTVRPIHSETSGTQGNPMLHVGPDGTLDVVWEESLDAVADDERAGGHHHGPPAGSGRAIMHAVSTDGGRSFHATNGQNLGTMRKFLKHSSFLVAAGTNQPRWAPRPVAPADGAFQTRPSLTATANGDLCIAWCELSEAGKQIVVQAIERGED